MTREDFEGRPCVVQSIEHRISNDTGMTFRVALARYFDGSNSGWYGESSHQDGVFMSGLTEEEHFVKSYFDKKQEEKEAPQRYKDALARIEKHNRITMFGGMGIS